MADLYEMEHPQPVAETLEEMREKLGEWFGVTLQGNRLTLRWNKDGHLVDVHAVIVSVTTPADAEEQQERAERMRKLYEKHGIKPEDIFYAETGETMQ